MLQPKLGVVAYVLVHCEMHKDSLPWTSRSYPYRDIRLPQGRFYNQNKLGEYRRLLTAPVKPELIRCILDDNSLKYRVEC